MLLRELTRYRSVYVFLREDTMKHPDLSLHSSRPYEYMNKEHKEKKEHHPTSFSMRVGPYFSRRGSCSLPSLSNILRPSNPVLIYLRRQGLGKNRYQKIITGLLGIYFTIIAFREPRIPISWNPKLMHSDSSRVQKTLHFPFRTGCPQDCRPYRKSSNSTSYAYDKNYVRITVEWYFGQPKEYNKTTPWAKQNGKTYEKGINFQCPESFVRTFQAASQELEDAAIRLLSSKKDFKIRPQKRMHASLSYLCCLDTEEADAAIKIIDEWIEHTEFDFTLNFQELQAWWESPNSVTNIVLVDDASQRTMMKLNHQLNSRLVEEGVPIVIPREDQMPFHATVTGFRYSKKGEDFDPKYEIESSLPIIQDFVRRISTKYQRQWTPPGRIYGTSFRVTHKPKRSPTPLSNHTHPLFDGRSSQGP